MDFEILPSGNLRIFLTGTDPDTLDDLRDELAKGYYHAEAFIAERFTPNGELTFIQPEAIGALTDASILTTEANYPDDSLYGPVPYPDSPVWWFPSYAIECPWETLAEKGEVIFTRAPNT